MKYVLVSGGVISGIGKGVIASSVGFMFKACGLRVTSIKIDPCMLPVGHRFRCCPVAKTCVCVPTMHRPEH